MQIRYKFFFGGDFNPFQRETVELYEKLSEEREIADPHNEKPLEEILPTLDTWPDYLISNSKSVFWQMEKAISLDATNKGIEIEELWDEAKSLGYVGEWLKKSEADESTKAMCFYMTSLHRAFAPNDITVDFRFYISEGMKSRNSHDGEGFSLEPYE